MRNILVPIDFSANSKRALDQALALGKPYDAKIHLLHVYHEKPSWMDRIVVPASVGVSADTFDHMVKEAAELQMEKFLQPYAGKKNIQPILAQGKPMAAILAAGESGKYDALVMGRRGVTGLEIIVGGTVDRVLRHCDLPLYVVPDHVSPEIRHLAVAVDFLEASEDALREAINLAKTFHAKMTVVYVQEIPTAWPAGDIPELSKLLERSAKENLDQFCKPYRESGLEISTLVVFGEAALGIAESCSDLEADLLVMGAINRHGVERILLGSVTEKVLRLAEVTTLVVHLES